MEMHAYSEDYLLTAQRILGDMLDYAVNEYEFDPDEFYKCFQYPMYPDNFKKEIQHIQQEKMAVKQ